MSERFSYSSVLSHGSDTVFAWHEREGAFARLVPPWLKVTLEYSEGIQDGQEARIRLGCGPASIRWIARHRDYRPNVGFTDEQFEGPFSTWIHHHLFDPFEGGGCRLTDSIEYTLPGGPLGHLAAHQVQRRLQEQFVYRHRVTANDLLLHDRYGSRPLRIAVSGASGLIGAPLTALLRTGGHSVARLVRRRPSGDDEIYWNAVSGEIETKKLEGFDAVVHLAGENLVAPRWTEAKKRRIHSSRVDGTRLLAEALATLERPPGVFVSSSAIGIYGNRGDERIDERSSAEASSFLARVCSDWEAACGAARDAGIRTANLRIGVVLSGAGGALAPMLPVFKLGLGGRLADRETYMSWIALDDVIGAIYHTMATADVAGPVNLTAPDPINWGQFTELLGRVLRRPTLLHVPSPIIRLATGEMGENVILSGARVFPTALINTGYRFLFPDIEDALRHQLGYTGSRVTT